MQYSACNHSVYTTCTQWLLYFGCSDAQVPSLVPRPPPFLPSVCIHNKTQERKTSEKQGRPGTIHHVNDVRWTQDGHRGGEVQPPKQCTGSSIRVLYYSFGIQTLAWTKLLILTAKKFAFKFSTYLFEHWPLPPYVHLASTHMTNAPRPFLFFTGPHYCECKWKVKAGEAWERGYKCLHFVVLCPDSHFVKHFAVCIPFLSTLVSKNKQTKQTNKTNKANKKQKQKSLVACMVI